MNQFTIWCIGTIHNNVYYPVQDTTLMHPHSFILVYLHSLWLRESWYQYTQWLLVCVFVRACFCVCVNVYSWLCVLNGGLCKVVSMNSEMVKNSKLLLIWKKIEINLLSFMELKLILLVRFLPVQYNFLPLSV